MRLTAWDRQKMWWGRRVAGNNHKNSFIRSLQFGNVFFFFFFIISVSMRINVMTLDRRWTGDGLEFLNFKKRARVPAIKHNDRK